jgi:hypothetical protein
MRFTYIQEDGKPSPQMDSYFTYVDDAATNMPAELAAFAQDRARYALGGGRTLRDAWLLGTAIGKSYGDKASLGDTTLEIRLLQASHKSELVLRYGGVTRTLMRLHPDYQPDGAIDLMAHEVTVCGKQSYRHAIRFDRGVYIDVRFRDFAVEDVARA